MSVLRDSIHQIFTWLTWPERRARMRQFTQNRSWPAAIIFYHRVANDYPNDCTISHDAFSQQLDLFARLGRFASLSKIQADQREGVRDQLDIAITFDDGYRDNLQHAIPELLRRKIPCTYFVTTDNVEHGRAFEHESRSHRPSVVHSKAEIREIADAGIEIGGHTATHIDLGKPWPNRRLKAELCDSRKKLQDWTGQPIHHFAFPFGMVHNISQAAIDMVDEAGFASFSTAFGGWNYPGGDDFHLARFHGDPSLVALRNWLTFDPRKLDFHSRLTYQRPCLHRPVAHAPATLGLPAQALPVSQPHACSAFTQ